MGQGWGLGWVGDGAEADAGAGAVACTGAESAWDWRRGLSLFWGWSGDFTPLRTAAVFFVETYYAYLELVWVVFQHFSSVVRGKR